MTERGIRIYGATWCEDTQRARQFLGEWGISYEWNDIDEDEQARAYVLQANDGVQKTPTILFLDGSILVEPSNAQLAEKLGLRQ